MYGSPPMSKDLNLPYPPPAPFGGHREEESQSDLLRRHHQQQQQQQQMSSGLLRFRSAPSSLLGEVCEDFLPVRPSSPETETMFARFLGTDLRNEIREKPSVGGDNPGQRNSHFGQPPPPPATSAEEVNAQHMMYRSQQQQMPNHSTVQTAAAYQVVGSMAMDADQIKNNGGVANSPNLVRQSSSPAGLFSHLNEENGYGMMRSVGGFRNGNNSIGDASNRLKGQISFSSRQNSLMSQISEIGSEGIEASSPEESSGGGGGGGRCYNISGFPVTSWEQTSHLSDSNFAGLKRGRDGEGKIMAGHNSAMHQNGEIRNHMAGLTHQFSLPKTSSEMAAIEKFLQFNDAVPCKVRAKRGCATHPRSIAERVRRTRISERMRKLQELVPNMDKQTNTADMLDLAVDYIKDLQRQAKTLNESLASCTCSSSKQNQYSNA